MDETYRCPNGREALLTFDKDTLRVEATTRDGATIGRFHFALVRPEGVPINLLNDTGEGISLKLVRADLLGGWHNQGIRERAVRLVADATMLEPVS